MAGLVDKAIILYLEQHDAMHDFNDFFKNGVYFFFSTLKYMLRDKPRPFETGRIAGSVRPD